jgi:hypothetical protein
VRHFKYVTLSNQYKSFPLIIEQCKPKIRNIVYRCLRDLKAIKIQINVLFVFVRLRNNSELEYTEKVMNSATHTILNRMLFENMFSKVISQIDGFINIFEIYGSNWTVDSIKSIDIRVGIFRPFKGSCYLPTPIFIRKKRCTVNVRNNDDERCFQWAVLSVLHPPTSRGSVSKLYAYTKFVKN